MAGVLPPAERRSSALVALYAGLSLFLLMVGDRIPQTALRGIGSTVFSPLDRVVVAGDRLTAAWLENQELHTRLARLEIENARLRVQAEENRRLRAQLDLPGFRDPSLKPVEVLALSGDRIPSSITLSSGGHGGVREGDIVVTSEGLVGRVAEVYPFTSRATLLTDPNTAVACEVESTGVLGILRFTATPRPALALTAVPFADTVLVGQRVLTSGLSRRYPRGIPVGRVASIGKDPGGLVQSITVEPAARLTRLRHVFLIAGPTGSDHSGFAAPVSKR
jgi:rod shape-determining protein MreC